MGLTIHYALKYNGTPEGAFGKISQMRDAAMDKPFKEVSDVVHFKGATANWKYLDKNDEWRWALIQAGAHVKLDESTSASLNPLEAILFRTWPGEGCEEANFGLCRYPAFTEHEFRQVPTRMGTGWHFRSFCKTQYASQVSIIHFLKCHTMVVNLLDYAKSLGILKEVHDEGLYWEKRDMKALALEVGEWNVMIAGFAGDLEKTLGVQGTLESKISKHPSYERLKKKAQEKREEKREQNPRIVDRYYDPRRRHPVAIWSR